MRWTAVLLVVATVGCTSLFGLDVPPNVDRDNDNHRDSEDNCPDVTNPDQSDFDRDGAGDACDECVDGGDADLDADGILDGCDGCVDNGSDVDKDGIPDNCDGCLESGEDSDGDGIDDACDVCIGKGQDIDGDQIDDSCDDCINTYLDVDADGIDDGCDTCVSTGVDTDADGVDDHCDPCLGGPQHDEDGDGVFDACDNCPAVANLDQADSSPLAVDFDGVGNACDNDTANANVQTFDAFTSQNPAWYIQGSGWFLDTDSMRFLGGGAAYRTLGSASVWLEVRASVMAGAAVANPLPGGLGVFASGSLSHPASVRVECWLQTSGGAGLVVLKRYGTAGPEIITSNSAIDLSQPVELTLRISHEEKVAACFLNAEKGPYASVTLQDEGTWYPGIEADNAVGGFRYFDVITR
jgi:hypothetical protein